MKRRAFTLIELLVVTVVILMLMALLMPAASSAWNRYLMARCQNNLKAQYDAQVQLRTERGVSHFTQGPNWQRELAPYVEDQDTIFLCPANAGNVGGTIVTENEIQDAVFQFIIHTDPNARDQSRYYTPEEAYPLTIPLTEENMFCLKIPGNGFDEWHVDDGEHKMGQSKGGDDIQFKIFYEDGFPVSVQTMPGKTSSREKYIYDFYVNGELFIHDWYHQYAKFQKSFELPTGASRTIGSGFCDYGLNKGTYEVDGENFGTVDPRLILILDYPKILAVYTPGPHDEWDRFFIDTTDVEGWMEKYGEDLEEDQDWTHYQSLRHFDQANVLFADGHVQAMTREELREDDSDSTIWYRIGP